MGSLAPADFRIREDLSTNFMHNSHAAPSHGALQADPLRAFMPIIIHVIAIGPTAEPEISVCKALISRR